MGLVRGDSSQIGDRVGGADVERYFEPSLAASINHMRAPWESRCPIMFRIVPEYEGTEPIPGFYEHAGEVRPSNWFVKLPVVAFAGSAEKMSFVAFDPYAEQSNAYDKSENPYLVCRNKLWKASGDKNAVYRNVPCTAWRSLLKDREAIMPDVRMRYFFQGPVYMSEEGSRCLAIDKRPVPLGLQPKQAKLPILSTSATGGAALLALGVKLWQESGGEIDITAPNFKDVLILANPKKHDRGAYELLAQQAEANIVDGEELLSTADGAEDIEEGGRAYAEYAVWNITRARIPPYVPREGQEAPDRYVQIKGLPMPTLDRVQMEIMARKNDLFGIFHVPSTEQICEWMAKMFADKPFLLEYGWRDRPEFMTPEVKAILSRRRTVATAASGLSDDPGSLDGGFLGENPDDLLGEDDLSLSAEIDDLEGDSGFFAPEPEPATKPAKQGGAGNKIANAAKTAMRGSR